MNYVSEFVNNVVDCIRSAGSSCFVCQPVCSNKSVDKNISWSVISKPSPSVNASETANS